MASSTLQILVATDGSAPARTALSAAVAFPWPRHTQARGVVVRGLPLTVDGPLPASVWAAVEASLVEEARRAQRVLRRRWAEARVVLVDGAPVTGILTEARRCRARVIVLGSRGHGIWSRLVLGSVSRAVVHRARGGVLVVKAPLGRARRFVIGLDGSPQARRAVALVASLTPPPGGRVTLLSALEPERPPLLALLPAAMRARLAGEAVALHAERERTARRRLEAAARELRRAGWTVETRLPEGVPLDELLSAVTKDRADVLAVGARGVGGVERLLLGSVAEGALARAAVSVLVAR